MVHLWTAPGPEISQVYVYLAPVVDIQTSSVEGRTDLILIIPKRQ